jgi:hypothetical protein
MLGCPNHVVYEIVLTQGGIRPFGYAVNGEGPDEFVVGAEFVRNRNPEHEPVSTREEVGWLTAVRGSRLHRVFWADGDYWLFFPVPVHVPEQEIPGPVDVFFPTLVGRRHVLSGRIRESLCVGGLSKQQ